ncbi:Protein of unknown function [Gramella sp. MAR_2010_147]|nr:Protein of unknown function [Gramella sp. MAR_2010_147]
MKVRSLITMSLVAGSLMMVSCGDEKKEKNEEVSHEEHEMNDHSKGMHAEETMEAETAKFSDEAVQQAFDEYLAVKDALVRTDASASRKSAQNLQNTLKQTQPEVAEIASKIVATEDVNKQRELFSELTAAMEPILKEAISSGKIYKQFCPMAFEGKGDYWYSSSEEIRNPYFGDKMLKCGRVDETIM